MIASDSAKCCLARSERRAHARQRRIVGDLHGVGHRDTFARQQFMRQVATVDAGVFVDIAQDVGQLQRAAQVVREQPAGLLLHPEYPHR
jgi:hypothetical protein